MFISPRIYVHVCSTVTSAAVRTGMLRADAGMYHVKELLGHEFLDTIKHYAPSTPLPSTALGAGRAGKAHHHRSQGNTPEMPSKGKGWKRVIRTFFAFQIAGVCVRMRQERGDKMEALRFHKKIENDGEVHVTGLPCHRGQHVEMILLIEQEEPGSRRTLRANELLSSSGLVGMWKDRTDIEDSVAFARRLRESAQTRK